MAANFLDVSLQEFCLSSAVYLWSSRRADGLSSAPRKGDGVLQ
jgi:hypothetical protein